MVVVMMMIIIMMMCERHRHRPGRGWPWSLWWWRRRWSSLIVLVFVMVATVLRMLDATVRTRSWTDAWDAPCSAIQGLALLGLSLSDVPRLYKYRFDSGSYFWQELMCCRDLDCLGVERHWLEGFNIVRGSWVSHPCEDVRCFDLQY